MRIIKSNMCSFKCENMYL